MIPLSLYRQDLETIRNHFIPFVELLQQTKLNNVGHCSIQSDEYLTALAINAIIDEIIAAIEKKYQKPVPKAKIKFSDAQAIIFYRLLLLLQIPATEIYFCKLRNDLVLALDKQLIDQAIYKQAVYNHTFVSENNYADFEYE